MESTVIMSLKRYDEMKERISFLENELSEEKIKFTLLKVFECKETYNGGLELDFADDAKQFIDKAFEPYADRYETKKLNEYAMWDYAKEKKLEPDHKTTEPEEQEQIF
jgi:hypothetical protein